tara:strand:+ start:85 stop:1239 length:1155 start_codon:yes stop_codon:yes gene_type:complete
MLTKNINLKFSKTLKKNKKIFDKLKILFEKKNQILNSFSNQYKDSFKKKDIIKFKDYQNVTVIGMGGSVLGSRAIYNFLKSKIKKEFTFKDDFDLENTSKKKKLNLIISKSGNTLETISNANVIINKKHSNIFITENKNSYLMNLAKKLKAEIIHHNNFIGGRYSVLSEVGMLPASLMGLKVNKFRRFNELIKNKSFVNSLVTNVTNTMQQIKKKKFNSIVLNYDTDSSDLFAWYQQLVAESLGKKGKGILPVISNMPKDNHSLMQLYLDGPKNSFYTFFYLKEKFSKKIINRNILDTHKYLKGKNLSEIKHSQYLATLKVFKDKNIPYRCFEIFRKNEETLGELFTFFMLETILLGKVMSLNPYDQPAVELIKINTKKILIKS